MARFGQTQIYHPSIHGNKLARVFLKIFGTVDTSSSHYLFMRIVKRLRFESVLDAGCGKGRYSFWVAQAYPNVTIAACDLSSENIEHCKKTKKSLGIQNMRFFVADLLDYKSEGAYDFIFSNHVLEHIVDNRKVLSNLAASLKPGGYIYIQMPNAVEKRLSLSKKFLRAHESWAENEHVGQTLTLTSLSEELSSLGCTVLLARHLVGFWGELRFELSEMALSYFRSRLLFAMLYPFLKILGVIDSHVDYAEGNGIFVLARKN